MTPWRARREYREQIGKESMHLIGVSRVAARAKGAGRARRINRYPLFPEDSEVWYTAAMGQPDVPAHPRTAGRADHLRNMAQSKHLAVYKRASCGCARGLCIASLASA